MSKLLSPRSLGLLLLLALGAVLAPAQARAPAHDAPAMLKVMSFNVRVPIDTDGDKCCEIRRRAMAALIRAQHTDVFGTQELVKLQADYLAAQLPDYR